MPSIQSLLTTTFGTALPTNKRSSTASSPEETIKSYKDWYNQPGNSIRKWDEEHGVHLFEDPDNGDVRFYADRNILFPPIHYDTFPEYFKDRTLDRFSLNAYSWKNQELAKKAYGMTVKYLRNIDRIINEYHGRGLYYYSKEKGSGKTFLSTILGNELQNLGHHVRWYSTTNLIQDIKAGFDKESGFSSSQVIDRARNTEILILDDIGVERQSAWLNETIYSILDYRLTTCKPTIFTSNNLPEELSYDERIVDRITKLAELVRMPEENVRRRLAQASGLNTFLEA